MIPPLKPSDHARARCKEFGIFSSDLPMLIHTAAVYRPAGPEDQYAPDDRIAVTADQRFAIVYNQKSGIIRTVLRHTYERWTH